MTEDRTHNESYRESVDERQENDKQKLLDALKDLPIIAGAARKTGISRTTIYRWIANDTEFKRDIESSQDRGRENLNDVMESRLLKIAENGSFVATKFYLQHNHKNYQPKPIFERDRTKLIDDQEKAHRLFDDLLDIKYAAEGDFEAKRRIADKNYVFDRLKEVWVKELREELEK